MRKYTIRASLILLVVVVLLITITSIIFVNVSDNYVDEKIVENLSVINKSVRTSLEIKINRDYDAFKSYLKQCDNDYEKLVTNMENYRDFSFDEYQFGYIENNNYVINEIVYEPYNDKISNTDYFNQKIAIFNFSDYFRLKNGDSIEDKTTYLFFQIDSFFCYTESAPYLRDVFEVATDLLQNNYFIVSYDGVVCHQKEDSNVSQLFTYLEKGNSANLKNEFKESFQNYDENNNNVFDNIEVDSKESFISFSRLSEIFSSVGLYVVQIYDKTLVRTSMGNLITPIRIALVSYVIIIMVGIAVLYYIVLKRNSDMEVSRLIHYYDKIYSFNVNDKGDIKTKNLAFKQEFSEYLGTKNIKDFEIMEKYDNIVEAVNHQLPITIVLDNKRETEDSKRYINFIVLRDMFGKCLIGRDVTNEEQVLDLRNEVYYNLLSHLPAIRILTRDLEEYFNQPRGFENGRVGNLPKTALVIFDVAKFREYNDLFGRKVGDVLIKKIANVFVHQAEISAAKAYHLEGNNLAVMFLADTTRDDVIKWVKDCIDVFKKPIDLDGYELVISGKFGISYIDTDVLPDLNAEKVIQNAFLALQKAKTLTSTSYIEYDMSLRTYVSKEQVMEKDLRTAIEKREFVMYLQAQYDNESQRIDGFEALIRWNNPKYISQSPAHFIELAEKNNMIIQIGNFVINETFRIAKRLEPYNVHVSMNVSPVQILQAGFVNEIIKKYKEYDLKPGSVAIEITETFLMNNFAAVTEKMRILKRQGFSIHLDDFGTGYSSMLYLRELPIDLIKIDQEFTKHLNTDKYSRAIVSKIISLAKNLELGIIAEGVEDEKQNQFLYKNGCNIIQGFLISRGMPEEEAFQLLEEYNVKGSKKVNIKKTIKK